MRYIGLLLAVSACMSPGARRPVPVPIPVQAQPFTWDDFFRATSFQCGSERWDVKTLSDPDVALALDGDVTPTTIEELAAWPPVFWHADMARLARETGRYSVEGTIVAVAAEDDRDVHVIIRRPSGASLVTEFPDPRCVRNDALRPVIDKAREDLVALLRKGVVDVRVVGVPFYDKWHGQYGAPPNGIELHPVLAIEQR